MLAREAAATAPALAMAPRQARSLTFIGQPDADASGALRPREPLTMAEALDAEARQSPTQAAMLHDALLAADVLRVAGDAEGAAKRWDRAIRIAPSDPRAPISRAADRMARNDVQHASLRLPDAIELAPFAEAFARALKIRGVVRADVHSEAMLPNDALRRAREAIDAHDLTGAASAVSEIARVAELRDPASWLAGSLGVASSAGRAESVDAFRIVAKSGAARRAIAARAIELGTHDLVEEALARAPEDAFTPADRAVLAALIGQEPTDDDLDALASSSELAALGAAVAANGSPHRRAYRVAGIARSRDVVRLARLVSSGASSEEIDSALEAFAGEHDGETRAVALEMAARAGNAGEVSDAILAWTGGDDEDEARDRSLAAGLVAERAGDRTRASAAYASAFALDSSSEGALRAIAALDPATDLSAKLGALADERREGLGAAVARLESVARATEMSDELREASLEAAHSAFPELPIAAFLAERAARRAGDVDGVLRWIRERRVSTLSSRDPIESALDDVREALLVVDTDPAIASKRLAGAHRARPMDVALRELFERVAGGGVSDRAVWRETRAAETTASLTKARLLLEAAREHERAGNTASALRDAELAHAASGDGLSRLALERAEIAAGSTSRLAGSLLSVARSTTDPRERREAYERLAELDAVGREDAASALLWHRTILEEAADYPPSLRYVEHALMTEGRIDEIEPVAASIAQLLATSGGPEGTAHAQLAARLKMRGAAGEWEPTRPMVELAASAGDPSLWALRSLAAHARSSGDDASLVRASLALAERTTRSSEIAALVLRAGDAAMRADDLPRAQEILTRASNEDPGDVVTWGLLGELKLRRGDARGAAEASEGLARTSFVDEHRLLAWCDAGRIWIDDVGDEERGTAAFEEAAQIDVGFQDVFSRLNALYTKRGSLHELASLLERRLATVTDDDDRVHIEVDRARALAAVGDTEAARRALTSALEIRPDHVAALTALAELCARAREWEPAEQAWVRLARLVPDPLDQRDIYARLGELYSEHAVNLSRAEVALKEVLKRAPDDVTSLERLVGVYKRQGDGPRAYETALQLLKMAVDPAERRARLVEIASIHETVSKDLRKAEQALEGARREYPNDVGALRALAEFYQRQRQLPAVNILLDRASADARRALSSGRFTPALFEVLEAVFELRGKTDAARVVAGSRAALLGERANVSPAGGRAADPRLDDLLAPEALGGAFRSLLLRAGDALDAAAALDLRALRTVPLAPGMAQSRIAAITASLGVPPVQVLVSPQLGRACVPSTSTPPSLVIGEGMLAIIDEPAAVFGVTRALKLVQAHASALVRTPPADLVILVAAWLQALNPSWSPQGIAKDALAQAARRIQTGMPRNVDPEAATIALEVAGTLGPYLSHLGASTIAWADRVALLAVGDPNAALDGIAWSLGRTDGAPREREEREQWALQTSEARDLLIFSTSDAYANARVRAGISS